jgi:uncharacterized damage-inducible protein DinB
VSDDSDFLGSRGDERSMLCGFLDWYRAVVPHKLEGLTVEQASAILTPSGLSAMGVVKHLTLVERDWFRDQFAGEAVDLPDVGDDNAPTFAVEPGDTIEAVIAEYRAENEHARRITDATPSLDQLSARAPDLRGHFSLRWVLVHMLEETARHAGHLDIMRESLDGATGD